MEPNLSNARSNYLYAIIGLGAAALIFILSAWYAGFVPFGTGAMPSLERAVAFPADFPEAGKAILTSNIEKLRTAIAKNQDDTTSWLDLAIQYKTVGDFEGAIEIWKYLVSKNPKNSVAYYNLGTTYHLDLKDYSRAEQYLKKAVEVDPGSALPYLALGELYRYSYKQDSSLAADILKQGIAKMQLPQRIDLEVALGSYYSAKSDIANARTYLTNARDDAKAAHNTALAAQLDQQIASLK
ncbi:MAG: hypothetical protein RLZZ416_294 [Candidatus Parcubacteria bacterium]|jgi:tetratricopeptide (TPR) repeat protein